MEIHSKDFYLLMVQVDHLSGEHLGYAVDLFYNAGASNVQIIPAVTKKNRPSHIVIIDCKPLYLDKIENLIVKELQAGGWHRIASQHRYLSNEILTFTLILQKGNDPEPYPIKAKHFTGGGIRPEHDDILKLREYIKTRYGQTLDYQLLYSYATTAIINPDKTVLNLDQV